MFKVEKLQIFDDFKETLPMIAAKFIKAEKNKKNPKLKRREEFIFDTFQCLTEIEKKINDLNLGLRFVSVFPNYKPWRKIITREEYMIYNLEFYYINIISVFDRILHLVNHLYKIGLADRHVSLNNIVTNRNIDKKIAKILIEYDKMLSGIRIYQNKIKHKERLKIKEFKIPATIEFLLKDSENLGYSKNTVIELKEEAKFYYKLYLRKKKKELNSNNKIIEDSTFKLLEELFNQYKKVKPK